MENWYQTSYVSIMITCPILHRLLDMAEYWSNFRCLFALVRGKP